MFSEHEHPNPASPNLVAAPSVVAYAPSEEPGRFRSTIVGMRRHSKVDVVARPRIKGISMDKIGFSEEKGFSHEQRYFDQSITSSTFDAHGRANWVWYNFIRVGRAAILERENHLRFEAAAVYT
jgi:hypothetical protein